jgi:glycine cleavage system aminomethyltransferase T
MSFEFLAPDAAQPLEGTLPTFRSPIEWTLRDQAASFTERAGWRVVTDYGNPGAEMVACRDSVGVADLSFLGKLELQADPGIASAIVAELTGGGALTSGRATLHDEVWWCPMTMGRVLALTPPERTGEMRDRLEAAASAASFASVIEMTAAYGSNALVGPLARETFARTMALDLRPNHFAEGDFAPVSVARTPGMVVHQGADLYLHLFGAGFAHYIWTVFVDAARHLGGRAVGVTALEATTRAGEVAHA